MEPRSFMMRGSLIFRDGIELYVNRAVENFQLEYHAHDFYEIAYVSEGRGYHHMGGKVLAVSKGDICLVPIGVPHVFRPSSASAVGRLIVYNCVFSGKLLEAASPHLPDIKLDNLFDMERGHMRDSNLMIEPVYQTLLDEYENPRTGSGGMLFTMFIQLLIHIVRLKHGTERRERKAEPADPIGEAIEYMRRRPEEGLSIRLMAEHCGMSERHFFRLFRQRTGQSFLAYLQHMRIRIGCELLLGTSHKISAIAEMSGYRDLQTFHTLFKRIVGMTPGQYRRTRKEETIPRGHEMT